MHLTEVLAWHCTFIGDTNRMHYRRKGTKVTGRREYKGNEWEAFLRSIPALIAEVSALEPNKVHRTDIIVLSEFQILFQFLL